MAHWVIKKEVDAPGIARFIAFTFHLRDWQVAGAHPGIPGIPEGLNLRGYDLDFVRWCPQVCPGDTTCPLAVGLSDGTLLQMGILLSSC